MCKSEELYKLYPRKIGRRAAFKAIEKAIKRLPLELSLEGKVVDNLDEWIKKKTAQFANSPSGQRGIFTPYPATWFNQSRYLDDPKEWELMSEKEEETLRLYREANVGVWRPE